MCEYMKKGLHWTTAKLTNTNLYLIWKGKQTLHHWYISLYTLQTAHWLCTDLTFKCWSLLFPCNIRLCLWRLVLLFSNNIFIYICCFISYQVYIILAKPERNVRSAFTTSTVVRMHVGDGKSSSAASRSSSLVNLWKRRGSTGETLRYICVCVCVFVALLAFWPG